GGGGDAERALERLAEAQESLRNAEAGRPGGERSERHGQRSYEAVQARRAVDARVRVGAAGGASKPVARTSDALVVEALRARRVVVAGEIGAGGQAHAEARRVVLEVGGAAGIGRDSVQDARRGGARGHGGGRAEVTVRVEHAAADDGATVVVRRAAP